MRILIFSIAYLPFVGGAELAVKEITDRLPDAEFDLLTVNLDGKQQPVQKVGNVTVHRIGRGVVGKYIFPVQGFLKAKKLHQERPYDIVWAIMANYAGLAALRFKKEFPEVNFLLTLQEGDSLKRIWSRTWFMRRVYKNIYRQADSIQTISTYLAKRAQKLGAKKRIEVIPNGVDIAYYQTPFPDHEAKSLRDQLGISIDEKIIITSSRLVHKNGLDTLIQAMIKLDAKLLILGSGALESKLKALAQECQIRDKVIFLGHVEPMDLPKYLKIADVFVRPSRSEGLGSAFLEAMAAGLPVIATKVGGIPDFLQDGQTGLFCEVNNPRDLANKVQLVLDDSELARRLTVNAKQLVQEKYDWEHIAKKMKEIFS